MDEIKPAQWSHDWYELTSTEELITVLQQAKNALHSKPKKSQMLWQDRIRKLEEELRSREEEAEQDSIEMER